ncbi:alpha-hydroxy-acid oxidizing protein, partial [Escherichia coli]|uniref:alpha-hydroxy-acid oxidizing protein n=1 Tax=Escherichia coli TaxID=562 RepID=UPI000CCB2DAA
LLGRAFLYALATAGQAGVTNLVNLIEQGMKGAMTLPGAKSINEIYQDSLVEGLGKEVPTALAPMAAGDAAKSFESPHPNPLPQRVRRLSARFCTLSSA